MHDGLSVLDFPKPARLLKTYRIRSSCQVRFRVLFRWDKNRYRP
jgi:hypothetical protein